MTVESPIPLVSRRSAGRLREVLAVLSWNGNACERPASPTSPTWPKSGTLQQSRASPATPAPAAWSLPDPRQIASARHRQQRRRGSDRHECNSYGRGAHRQVRPPLRQHPARKPVKERRRPDHRLEHPHLSDRSRHLQPVSQAEPSRPQRLSAVRAVPARRQNLFQAHSCGRHHSPSLSFSPN
jgi:hypothetical protein